eukprot:SAG25_NODE_888_length_4924_cov_17.004560_6_plen_63_part_00
MGSSGVACLWVVIRPPRGAVPQYGCNTVIVTGWLGDSYGPVCTVLTGMGKEVIFGLRRLKKH